MPKVFGYIVSIGIGTAISALYMPLDKLVYVPIASVVIVALVELWQARKGINA